MADEPISALTQIAAPTGTPPYPTTFTSPTTGAMIEVLDTTNTSMASSGTNSKIAPGDMIKGFLAAGTNVTLTETAGIVTIAASGGGGGSPGGSSGQIQTNNGSGGFGALAVPLPVASGGTGDSALTQYDVLIGAGTGGIQGAAPGAAGQMLTSLGASANPAFAPPVVTNQVYSEIPDGGFYNVSTSMGNLSTDVSITLPNAGTYMLWANIRCEVVVTASSAIGQNVYLLAQLYDSTNARVVPLSNVVPFLAGMQAVFSGQLVQFQGTATVIPIPYAVTGATTIHIQGLYAGSATVSTGTGSSGPGFLSNVGQGFTFIQAMQIY